jgi:tetratricopeptide (TPR) repeat protein
MDNIRKLLEEQKFIEAEIGLREFIAKNRKDGQAIYYLAQCLFSQDRFEEAANYFIILGELIQNEPEICYMTGRAFLNTGNYKETIKYIKKAIEKGLSGNNLLKARHLLALSYCGSKRFNSAEKVVRDGIKKVPDYYSYYDLLGRILISRMDYKRARETYNKIIELKLEPQEDTLFHIAFTYIIENKIDIAIDKLEKLLKRDKNHLKAHYTLAALYFHSDNIEKAIEYWKKCIEIDPERLGKKALENILLCNQEE